MTEESRCEAIFVSVEASLLDVAIAAHTVRELVAVDDPVSVTRCRPGGRDDGRVVLGDGQLKTSWRTRHYITTHRDNDLISFSREEAVMCKF